MNEPRTGHHPDPDDRIDELIALAALGELSHDEERELERATGDPTVAAELAEALDTAALLQAATPEDPPAALRASVLGAIDDVPQERPAPAEVVDLGERRRRRYAVLGAVAAALILVVGGLVAVNAGGDDDPIDAIVEADDAVTRVLEGELDGDLSVVHSPSANAIVVEGSGMTTMASNRTLQLWLVSDDGARSIGLFRPDEDGTVSERLDDVDPTGFVLGVTEEPAEGSETPTLPILASA